MFTSYRHNNSLLYNNLVELSRNKFFYKELNLLDNFETRVLLIFFHFIIILKLKSNKDSKKNFQNIFDNLFQNIEVNIRELGYGDTKVNNTMKNLNKIFYDILLKIGKNDQKSNKSNIELLNKYFYQNKIKDHKKVEKLAHYMEKFENFCFDLDINYVLKGTINFKYK